MSASPSLLRLLASSALIGLLAAPVLAQSAFDAPAAYGARVGFAGPARGPIYPGGEVSITGQGFGPGQEVRLLRGTADLVPELRADAEGKIDARLTLPADAAPGMHPVVIQTEGPDSAGVVDLKVSKPVPLMGEDLLTVEKTQLPRGLYQLAFGQDGRTIFVTASTGRGEGAASTILKLDRDTLEILAESTPPMAPAQGNQPAVPFSAYGIGTDNTAGTLWVTNTRQDTIAVYDQADLSLVKQFAPGTAVHGRDVLIDGAAGRAYVSAGGVEIFDTATLEKLASIKIPSKQRGGTFRAMGFSLDTANRRLYTVSLESPEVARIDLTDNSVEVFAVEGLLSGTSVDVDPATGTIYVVAQGSDNLVALDASGGVLFDVAVGANPHTLAFDPASGAVFISNRMSDTIAVVDGKTGAMIANVDGGSFPNYIDVAGDGTVYAVNKSRGENDPEGDFIRKITLSR